MKIRFFVTAVVTVAVFIAGAPVSQAAEKKEAAKGDFDSRILLRDDLILADGKEVTVSRMEVSPGWVGERHFHPGDVYVYVLDGTFVIDIDGQGRKTLKAGEIYHEKPNIVMQARNGDTQTTKILLFQVGKKGDALIVPHD